MEWAEQNKLLPATQSGFRKNRSCQDHILRLCQHITDGFNKNQKTEAIFFDLEKAFDKASHQGIIHKIQNLGMNTHLLNWIRDFLNGRSYFVSINQKKSSDYPILSGVPQGSCLSPTLFNLYFSDKTKDLPININNALFADDLCIWSAKKSLTESKNQLKKSIQKITEFCLQWGLTLNKAKTIYTVLTTAGHRN